MTTLSETAATVASELRAVANALVYLQESGLPPGTEEIHGLARCAKALEDAAGHLTDRPRTAPAPARARTASRRYRASEARAP
jgi:hypothetical protein